MLDKIAAHITALVGTMWAAILFTILAAVSLPAAIATHDPVVIIGWIAQTFLQLVLLPIIMVGQNQASAATETLIRETHDAVVGHIGDVHNTVKAVHAHITGDDA